MFDQLIPYINRIISEGERKGEEYTLYGILCGSLKLFYLCVLFSNCRFFAKRRQSSGYSSWSVILYSTQSLNRLGVEGIEIPCSQRKICRELMSIIEETSSTVYWFLTRSCSNAFGVVFVAGIIENTTPDNSKLPVRPQ